MKDSAFLQGVHHAYAQIDGTYAPPDIRRSAPAHGYSAERPLQRRVGGLR